MSDENKKPTPEQSIQSQPVQGVTLIPPPGAGDWYTLELSELRNYEHAAGEMRAIIQHEELREPVRPYSSNMYGSQPEPPHPPIRVVKTSLLFQKTEASAIGRLSGELEQKKNEVERLTREKYDSDRKLENLHEELEKTKKDLAECKRKSDSNTSTILNERNKSRRMEEDLGKVRQAVGDIRMKEILAGG